MQIIQNTKEQKKNSDLLLSLENELTDFRIFDAMVGVTNTTPTLTARLANASCEAGKCKLRGWQMQGGLRANGALLGLVRKKKASKLKHPIRDK